MIGSTYAVVAIGFALAFTVLRVINFAHPDIFMVGMFAGLVAAAEVAASGSPSRSSPGRSVPARRLSPRTHGDGALARPRRADDA